MNKMTQCYFKILQESWGERDKNEIGKVIIVVNTK